MHKPIAATKKYVLTPKLRDSMTWSSINPKSVCRCGHTGDGARSQHTGFGGHGSCIFDGGSCCDQFSWAGWTREYKDFMRSRGHTVR